MRQGVAKGTWAMCMVVLLTAVATPAVCQLPPVPAAMDRLDFLVGEWEGSGWMEWGPGQRAEFSGSEVVERRMGGRLVVVEGSFTAVLGPPGTEPTPVHQAFGVFSRGPADEGLVFRTYTARGGNGEAHEVEVGDERIEWGYEGPRGLNRYTITLTESGAWHEVGHVSTDGGATWEQFFEMTLQPR